MNHDTRIYPINEIRIEENDSGPIIRTSLKFNSLSVPLGFFTKFREQISETAFDSAIDDENHEVRAYWHHDISRPLGRRTRGTVRISKTKTLFKADIYPDDTSWGVDAVKSIKRGDVDGMSFGFRVYPEGEKWSEDKEQNLIRTLTNVDLIEVSPTPTPAYLSSSASVRMSMSDDDFENFVQEQIRKLHPEEYGNTKQLAAVLAEQTADRSRRERLQRTSLRQHERNR